MPTIAYISSILPARSETFVYREIRELRRRGWDVVCVSLNAPTEAVAGLEDLERDRVVVYDGLNWVGDSIIESVLHPISSAIDLMHVKLDAVAPGESMSLPARAKLFVQCAAGGAMARRLRERGVKHIHCHFAHAPTTVGMYAAMQLGVSFSFTGHANDLFQRRALLRRKLQRAAFVNCISEWHRDFYIKIEPTSAAKCHIVRCGVDVDAWKFRAEANAAAGNRPIQILTVCRLVEKKGVDNLLRGLGKVARDGGTFEMTIAGDGPQRAALEAIALEENIQPSVKFLGAVDNERVRHLLQHSDAFALPCRDDSSGDRDGIPVVLMEAMACGLPVISGDLPAIRELVSHDRSGLLVDGTNVSSIAESIARLAGNPALRQSLAAAGRQRVVEEFSLSENVTRIERLLRHSLSTDHS
ncbi:MAG TPA: glycosyltransferase family 4 protein [Tepidisphaeraceae bacterium]|nr:glycosyltransferase family 4 protein [Tepidisphaeraceae bacterium]